MILILKKVWPLEQNGPELITVTSLIIQAYDVELWLNRFEH